VFVGGCAAGAYFTNYFVESQRELDKLSSREIDNLVNHDSGDWHKARDNRNTNRTLLSAGFAAGLLGAVGFTVSFAF
jgi:hypothetical protein